MMIGYTQLGEPNQNAHIERSNRTHPEVALDLHLLPNLAEVRGITHWWSIEYNEYRPHESLGDLLPIQHVPRNAKGSKNSLSPRRGRLRPPSCHTVIQMSPRRGADAPLGYGAFGFTVRAAQGVSP